MPKTIKPTMKQKIKLSKIQKEMLKEMLNWTEYSYGYNEFEDTVNADKKTLIKEMKKLRELELVKLVRGGIDDDTGMVVGGTGFYIKYEKRDEVKNLINQL